MRTTWILSLIVLFVMAFTGCSLTPWVKPYEREQLADPIMLPNPHPLDSAFMNHVYQSREGARGAEGVAGGGCGCN